MNTTEHVVVRELGGPNVLHYEEAELRRPGSGEIVIRQSAVGVNFIDVYFRTGLYPGPACPFVPGMEGAGVVNSVGPGVDSLQVGDRVGYASPPLGAYATQRVMPADRVVKLPSAVSDEVAAAMLLKGMTAEYLLHRTYPVGPKTTLLVHAAAGGVGLLLCQWAKQLGARVLGTVGSEAKAELAARHGCDHPILYKSADFRDKVRELTGGEGVDVVYDSVGKSTFASSLDCLKDRGLLVLFGQSSGKVPPLDPSVLDHKGSLFLTRPSLRSYTATRADLELSAERVFGALASGTLSPQIGARLPLREAAAAHAALESRQTTGSTVLVP